MRATLTAARSVGALCALLSARVTGQVPPAALSDIGVETKVTADPGTKIYTYTYRVTNPSQNALPISALAVDITLPTDSIRPTGVAKLPAGRRFQDPEKPTGLPPSQVFPYSSPANRWVETGLNFIPVGLSSTNEWAVYRVLLSSGTRLIGNAIKASWVGIDSYGESKRIMPGQSVDGFILTSFGLPGIRKVEVQPSPADVINVVPPEWKGREDDADAVLAEKERLVNSLGYLTSTLGPTALPAGYTNTVLVTRLQGYVDQSAGLSWIRDRALVQQLTGLLTQTSTALRQNQAAQAKTLLQQFVTAVTSASLAQRRQEASDLLSFNAQFIIDHITVVSPLTVILSPAASQRALNETQTLTLTLKSGAGPFGFGHVQAVILTGPNAGKRFSGAANSSGQ